MSLSKKLFTFYNGTWYELDTHLFISLLLQVLELVYFNRSHISNFTAHNYANNSCFTIKLANVTLNMLNNYLRLLEHYINYKNSVF